MLIFKERKSIRARTIVTYAHKADYKGIVCFSCGNASRELKIASDPYNIPTLQICPNGDLQSTKWWTPEGIHKVWPDYFDGTSGHLPLFLMHRIAEDFKGFLGKLYNDLYELPTGSGETITCLRLVYPNVEFQPVYNLDPPTNWEAGAPLNDVVEAMGVCMHVEK